MGNNPVESWKKQIQCYSVNNYFCELNRIDGQLMNSSGRFSQDSLWESSVKFNRWWENYSVNQRTSHAGSSLCQCLTTFHGMQRKWWTSCTRMMAKRMQEQEGQQDSGKVKADDDEPGRLCLDKFFDSEQSTLSNRLVKYRETWRKRSQSRRSVEFSRMAKRCSSGCKYRETCRDRRRPGTPEFSWRFGKYRETCRPRISRKFRKLRKLGNRRQWRRLATQSPYFN